MTRVGKRTSIGVLATALAALGLWYFGHVYHASAAGALPDLVEKAPGDATMIAYVDFDAIRHSRWTAQLESLAQPAQVDPDYTAFINATGFDYQKDLDRVALYTPAQGKTTFVFAEGRFDQKKIEQYALRAGQLHRQDGHDVYVVPSATPGKDVSFSFVSSSRIALSDGGNLETLLSSSSQAAFDAPMRERLSRVSGAPAFAVFKTAKFLDGVAANSTPGRPGLLGQLQSMQWIALALQPGDSDILLSAEGECARPEQAQQVASTLELLRAIFRGALNNPKSPSAATTASAAAVGKLLDEARITSEAERVRLIVSMTPDMLQLPRPNTPAAK